MKNVPLSLSMNAFYNEKSLSGYDGLSFFITDETKV